MACGGRTCARGADRPGHSAANAARAQRAGAADPIAEALPHLQAGYVDFAALHYKEGDKLSDLAARSDGRISLIMPGDGRADADPDGRAAG